MHVINARNVHEALPEALRYLFINGVENQSRNGPVLVSPVPVTTLYRRPVERVMFWPERDANPFFHLMESLWMLGGRRDVAFVQRFASNMGQYSDDGKNFHGAYGFRWRRAFDFDQLRVIADRLKRNPDDRRQVLGIWSPKLDLAGHQSDMKDLPCNLTVHFQINPAEQVLDMSVFNRSNDIVWGCYGANAVHFSFLQEYMAAQIGVPVGRYWQVSCNWHGYLRTLEPLKGLAEAAQDPFAPTGYRNPYDGGVEPFPLLGKEESADVLDQDINMFLDEGANCMGYRSRFIRRVALPLLQAWLAFKDVSNNSRHATALEILECCEASDWRVACSEWVTRRAERKALEAGVA